MVVFFFCKIIKYSIQLGFFGKKRDLDYLSGKYLGKTKKKQKIFNAPTQFQRSLAIHEKSLREVFQFLGSLEVLKETGSFEKVRKFNRSQGVWKKV